MLITERYSNDIHGVLTCYDKCDESAGIMMLGFDQPLKWRYKIDGLHIDIPQLSIDRLPCQYA